MTKSLWQVVVGLAVVAAVGTVEARPMDVFEHAAVMESLSRVHPRQRGRWLSERGLDLPGWNASLPQASDDSTGLVEVGRWSYGPSFDVDGRVSPAETLVALARGSGVSLLRFARSDRVALELLCDINAGGLVNRVRVRDSLLFVGSRRGLETWDITDERNPARLSVLGTALNDFALQDTFAFVISDDSFKAYSIADPARPYRVGACRDSGEVIGVTNNAAFLGDRWGLYVVDVTDPAVPHRLTALGYATECVTARGDYCYITTYNPSQSGDIEFRVLNVADPGTPYQVGMVDQAGGYDIELRDTFAYCSGDGEVNEMTVVSVANPSQPWQVSRANTPGWSMGIWANGRASSAFVGCHWEGLNVYDVRNPAAPIRDTWLLGADEAVDIHIDNGRAYIANEKAGLKILDITDPTRPTLLGSCDTFGQPPSSNSVVARDSFAFVGWTRPRFRVLDVTEPSVPTLVGAVEVTNPPEDMVIRDSLVYIAEIARFQVVNVARPREPRLVGSCVIGAATDLTLTDTLAFASRNIVNISDPSNPVSLGTFPVGGNGNAVLDTFVYQPAAYDSLVVFSVANPLSPRRVTSLVLSGGHIWNAGVALVDTLLHIGGDILHILSVADPACPREVGTWRPPYDIRRLHHDGRYLYAVCYDAGVCVLESSLTGVAELRAVKPLRSLRVWPTPTVGSLLHIAVGDGPPDSRLALRDVAGRLVRPEVHTAAGSACSIDISSLPAGVYLVEHRSGSRRQTVKFVKR